MLAAADLNRQPPPAARPARLLPRPRAPPAAPGVVADGDQAAPLFARGGVLQKGVHALHGKGVEHRQDELGEEGDDAERGAAANLAPGRLQRLLREVVLHVYQAVHLLVGLADRSWQVGADPTGVATLQSPS